MAPPSLVHRGSPGPVITEEFRAIIRAVALEDFSAAGGSTSSDFASGTTPLPVMTTTSAPALVPASATPVAGAVVQAQIADPLHHRTTLTPPVSVPQGTLQTPDAEQLILPDPCISAVFVPRERQEFKTMNEGYIFYKDYAKLAGFSLRTARTSKETMDWVCSLEGFNKSKKDNEDKITEKGSKRCGCKAYVKIKNDKKRNVWFFDHVQLAHNHTLQPSPRMTRYMHAHKSMEEGIGDLFTIMTSNGVPHQAALHVMAFLHGDRQRWTFTEKDLENLYVSHSCCSSKN
ncbi:unnamed protein product [Urochloa humidicola]